MFYQGGIGISENFTARTELLIGKAAIERLAGCRVAVFGVGGVGSYAVEALARSAVGEFLLVDNDIIVASNINRQLHATADTIGLYKTQVMAKRILSINPAAKVRTKDIFCLPDNVAAILDGDFDYILDAVDTVSAKLGIVKEAARRGIPVISAMGAGNKLDPVGFEVADIYETSVCPLCRVMRRELKKAGIQRLKVVYSKESPITPQNDVQADEAPVRRQAPGSIAFVPSVAGLIMSGAVIRDLIEF